MILLWQRFSIAGLVFGIPQHIIVKPYNPDYSRLFDKEKERLVPIFGDNFFFIEHIGSTAVAGLRSKPIIDILVAVKSLPLVDERRADFEKLGYEYLGEFGIKGRRYLRKGGDERTHQIHVFRFDDEHNLVRHLAVRDYLRAHPAVAREYGELKSELALSHPYDIDGYCETKEAFVSYLEAQALAWYCQ